MKLLRIDVVDFCKQLNRFIDELYAGLTDAFISEAKEFVGRAIQLWVLYCKYRSLFEQNWSLSDHKQSSTLFACGWLLFLAAQSEINASWKMLPDLLYRYFSLLNAVMAFLGKICPQEAKQFVLAEMDNEILETCHSLVALVVERISEEGIWFQNDLIRSVAGLGRHIDRMICSSDEVWRCWLLDGRVFFSDELRSMCERTLQLGLSPIIRSPSKNTDSNPVSLMPESVKWLLKLADDCNWPSACVLQHWPSFSPAKLESLLQQHHQRPFRYGSNDPMVVAHRHKLSILIFYRLLEALVGQEVSRRTDDHVTPDFSQWLDSTLFLKVTLYIATQVVIGCYKIPVSSQKQLASAFDVAPLETIAALRNVLKMPLIDNQFVRSYLFSVYEQFVLFDAWKDRSLTKSHLDGHVRSLYRAGHSFAIEAIQFLERNLPCAPDLSRRALVVIDRILRDQAALLLAPLGVDAVVVCTLYGLSKLLDAGSIKLIPTYKLLLKHRSVGDSSIGPELLRFYNDSFVPVMKATLISVSAGTGDHEMSAHSSDSSFAVSSMYKRC